MEQEAEAAINWGDWTITVGGRISGKASAAQMKRLVKAMKADGWRASPEHDEARAFQMLPPIAADPQAVDERKWLAKKRPSNLFVRELLESGAECERRQDKGDQARWTVRKPGVQVHVPGAQLQRVADQMCECGWDVQPLDGTPEIIQMICLEMDRWSSPKHSSSGNLY